MPKLFAKIVVAFLFFMPLLTWGSGGFVVGSGGDAIHCKGAIKACQSARGQRVCRKFKMSVIWAQEFFVAQMLATPAQVQYLATWKALTAEETLARLWRKIDGTPLFEELSEIADSLGRVRSGMGFGQMMRMDDIRDSVIPIDLPSNCRQHQAVVRIENQGKPYFMFDSVILDMLSVDRDARQEAIINFHEYLYHYGKVYRGHATSLETQSLIVDLLSQDLDQQATRAKLKKYNFIDQ